VDEKPVHGSLVPGPEMNLAQCKNVWEKERGKPAINVDA